MTSILQQSELSIRRATLAEVESLVNLAKITFRDTYSSTDDPADIEDYVATHFTPAIIASDLQDAASTLLVAQIQQQLIGYAHIRVSTIPSCVTGPSPIELVRLYLRQECVGKGYGVSLMRAVLDVARRENCETIWLSVYDKNVHAVEFYKRWGFVNVGTKSFLFGGKSYDDPVMAARVSPVS